MSRNRNKRGSRRQSKAEEAEAASLDRNSAIGPIQFFCYSGTGGDLVTRWLRDRSGGFRGQVLGKLNILVKTELQDWKHRRVRPLGNGLFEIKVKDSAGNVEWRLVGMIGPGRTFTTLVICNHKQRVYDPPDWLDTAKARKKQIENDPSLRAKESIPGLQQ